MIKNFFKNNKKTSVFLSSLVILIIFFLVIIFLGLYPIAIVNGSWIMAYRYHNSYQLAYNYYSFYNYNNPDLTQADKNDFDKELKKAAIENSIDSVFINSRLSQELGATDLNQKINNEVDKLLSDGKVKSDLLDKVLKTSEKNAREYFLNDLAKSQILSGRLALESKNILEWISEQRKVSKVSILIPGVIWNADMVEIK